MLTALRFSSDSDLLLLYPKLDQIFPRLNPDGTIRNNWDNYRLLAINEIERRLRGRKDTAEPIELGRLGLRTKERLRWVEAYFALHFVFVAADSSGDAEQFFSHKAKYFLGRAEAILEDESEMMDYDIDNSGNIDDIEKDQPMPNRLIRG